jgi:type III secretion protein D
MKSLRILTGVHAGAQVSLTAGTYRIGVDEAADIRLTDWVGPDAQLDLNEAGLANIWRVTEPGEQDQLSSGVVILLTDFVPMQFDELVVCIGPEGEVWPSDVDLLSTLLASPVKHELASVRQQQKRRRKTAAIAGLALLGGIIVAGVLLGTMQLSKAAYPRDPADRARQIELALSQAHYTDLHVQISGSAVVVSGLVSTPADDIAVRTLLQRVAPFGVERRYDDAQLDARSIEDSISIDGIHTEYIGKGKFAITGEVAAEGQLESALARVRSDLSPNIKQIIVRATQTAHAAPEDSQKYSEMVSSDNVEYVETPDGVKHIYAFDPAPSNAVPAVNASDSDAAGSLADASTADTPAVAAVKGPGAALESKGDAQSAQTNSFLPLPH